jgi:hypothetical protein
MPDFLSQTFLGVPAIFGDDRRLTNYVLLQGKVVFQETAVAWTAVPQRLGHFARQQTLVEIVHQRINMGNAKFAGEPPRVVALHSGSSHMGDVHSDADHRLGDKTALDWPGSNSRLWRVCRTDDLREVGELLADTSDARSDSSTR